MKHSDLKVGMKVKRVSNFNESLFSSTKGNISTVKEILRVPFLLRKAKNNITLGLQNTMNQ